MIKKDTVEEISLNIPPFRLLANDYITPKIKFSPNGKIKASWEKIVGIDDPLILTDRLTFNLSFPFSIDVSYTIYSSKKGFTSQFIIDEIRRSYRHLYRHSNKPACTWESTFIDGKEKKYQVSYPHRNLFVEDILINEKQSNLKIIVGGYPVSFDQDDLPF